MRQNFMDVLKVKQKINRSSDPKIIKIIKTESCGTAKNLIFIHKERNGLNSPFERLNISSSDYLLGFLS